MSTYLIIGGSTGIGLESCKLLLEEGHKVIATYRNTAIDLKHENFTEFFWDSNDPKWPQDVIPDDLNGLVYCPGIINLKPFHRLKDLDFINDFNVQVIGAIHAIQQNLPRLKLSKNASVVLFSTIAASKGYPFHSLVGASKGAIEGLTKSLASEFAPSIRFNCIAPSVTKTKLSEKLLNTDVKIERMNELHPMKRIGDAVDIANMVVFLLSNKSSWITGQTIHVDGGKSSLN